METIVHVPDGWVLSYPDVVAELLESEGAGALRISPNLGLVMATSRTYATTPDGSYGQGIPGMAESEAFSEDEIGHLTGLRQDDGFRTNIGFANVGGDPVDIVVTAHAANGDGLATLSYLVPASSRVQANQPLPDGTVYATVTAPHRAPSTSPTPRSSTAQPTIRPTSPPCERRIEPLRRTNAKASQTNHSERLCARCAHRSADELLGDLYVFAVIFLLLRLLFLTLAQVSRRVTMRLKTGASSVGVDDPGAK